MNLALFDFDGTITDRETFPLFVRYAAPALRVAVGSVALMPLVAGYRLGIVSGSRLRSVVARVAFTQVAAAQVNAAGERFARDLLPTMLRPEAMQRIDWHRARGDAIVVVSGAFDCYLAPWCRQQGLDLETSTLEQRDGWLTGRYRGAQCVGAEKARRVRERFDLRQYDEIYAYGDTPEDGELLALAGMRYYRGERIVDPPT